MPLGHVHPLGTEGTLPQSPPQAEKLVSGYCTLKKGQWKMFVESVVKKVYSQKRSTKIALGTGGTLSTMHLLVLVPLDNFLNIPLARYGKNME